MKNRKRLKISDLVNKNSSKKEKLILKINKEELLNFVFESVDPLAIKLLYVACSRLDLKENSDELVMDGIKITFDELSLVGFTRIHLLLDNLENILQQLANNYFVQEDSSTKDVIGFLKNDYHINKNRRYLVVDINERLKSAFMNLSPIISTRMDLTLLKKMKTKTDLKMFEIISVLLSAKDSVDFTLDKEDIDTFVYRKDKELFHNSMSRLYNSINKVEKALSVRVTHNTNISGRILDSVDFYVERVSI